MFWKTIIIACLAVGVLADYTVPEDKKELLRSILVEQCNKNGAQDKATEVEKAGKTFAECVMGLIDVKTVTQEIEDAKPNGALDEVFGKYCAKSPQLKGCINALLESAAPCVDASARDQLATVKDGAAKLIDFVCYKDGDRIALFIAEGGPECFREKADNIRECAQAVRDSVDSVDAAKQLSTADKCRKFDTLSQCVVAALESCSTPTPGNMAESLFRFVRKSSPCHAALPK